MSSSTRCALTLLLCAGLLSAQDSKTVGQGASLQLSKEFRKAALRCLDANMNLSGASLDVMVASGPGGSEAETREKESEFAAIKLDASRQLTEAKIAAESPDEKKVYQLLKAEYELTPTGTESLERQERYNTGSAQCRLEARTIIDPENEDLPDIKKHVDASVKKDFGPSIGCLAIKAALDKEAAAALKR
jgi:hypothetical protein